MDLASANIAKQLAASVENVLTEAQARLNALGFGPVPTSGSLDTLTRNAISRFQKSAVENGVPLTVNGSFDDETRAVLDKVYSNSLAAKPVAETQTAAQTATGAPGTPRFVVQNSRPPPATIVGGPQLKTSAGAATGAAAADVAVPFFKKPTFWVIAIVGAAGLWYFTAHHGAGALSGADEPDDEPDDDEGLGNSARKLRRVTSVAEGPGAPPERKKCHPQDFSKGEPL